MYKLEELNNSKLSELKDIAKELDMKNYDKLKKLDLTYAILDHQAEHNNPSKANNEGENQKATKPLSKGDNNQPKKNNKSDFKKEKKYFLKKKIII